MIGKMMMLLLAFLAGWTVQGYRLDLKHTAYIAQQTKEFNAILLQQKQQREQLEHEITVIQESSFQSSKGINNRFELASDRVRNSTNPSSKRVPIIATSSNGSKCACKAQPHRENGRDIKALELARDCDLLAERYNRILRIYNAVKSNQSKKL